MDALEIIRYWETTYASEKVPAAHLNLEPLMHGFLSAFSPGKSYHYVVNFKTLDLQFVSESVREFVGMERDKITFKNIIETAAPDQIQAIKLKEQVIYDFYFNFLPKDLVNKYKLVYLYRMIDANKRSRIILHQALPLSIDEHGNLEQVLSTHTDITYLKIQPTNTISFFSLTKEPSYINISTEEGKFDPENRFNSNLLDNLTPREKEIITLLAKGLSSKEISSQLNLSVHTIQKHRKNILQKTGCTNTSQLISSCIMAGLVME